MTVNIYKRDIYFLINNPNINSPGRKRKTMIWQAQNPYFDALNPLQRGANLLKSCLEFRVVADLDGKTYILFSLNYNSNFSLFF